MSRLLICTLVLSLAFPKIVQAEEATNMTTLDGQYEYVEENFEEVMSTLEEDITYEEGSIEIAEKEEFVELFGTEAYQNMEEGIDYLNKLISSGDLTLTKNGTIYETNDDELVVQGRNVNKDIWKWYGCRILRNHSKSKKIASQLSTLSNSCGMVSSGALILEKLDPEPYSKAFLGGFAIGTSFGWRYVAQMSSSISDKNKKYGTILKLTWAFYYEVESQTSTTTT